MIQDVIDGYNAAMDAAAAEETYTALLAALERENLTFGGRLLCNVLRPQLLSEREYAYIGRECALVLAALAKAYAVLAADPDQRRVLALTELEEQALAIEPRYAGPTPFARLDSFFSHADHSLQFVEYNAETPAGVGYEDVLSTIFLDLPPVRRLAAELPVRMVEGSGRVLATLLDLRREAGLSSVPAVAILDWADVPTRPEFEIMARRFALEGVPAAFGTPDELTYHGGSLRLRDEPVTIIYKRVLASEFLAKCGLGHPLVQALRDGTAIMANPFQCKLLHKKAIFAVLSDERTAHWYEAAELAAIQAHVPWTRVVEDRQTTIDGATIDLLPWMNEHRQDLVLKPNDEYGGKGVVLGWEVDPAAWSAAIQDGLGAPTVVQRRVTTTAELFPVWDAQARTFSLEPRLVDLDPYAYRGREIHGVLTRLSAGSLLNVTAGSGSITPTLIVDV